MIWQGQAIQQIIWLRNARRAEMLNVIPREYSDGRVCADCSGGPLMPMGYAILQERPTSRVTVQVDVERDQLDRLIDDVAAVNETVDGIIQKIGKIKEG